MVFSIVSHRSRTHFFLLQVGLEKLTFAISGFLILFPIVLISATLYRSRTLLLKPIRLIRFCRSFDQLLSGEFICQQNAAGSWTGMLPIIITRIRLFTLKEQGKRRTWKIQKIPSMVSFSNGISGLMTEESEKIHVCLFDRSVCTRFDTLLFSSEEKIWSREQGKNSRLGRDLTSHYPQQH